MSQTAVRGASQSWCDPRDYNEIVGVDFGRKGMSYHCLFSGEERSGVPHERAVETFESFPDGTLIIAEMAHLATPRTSKSLAQPFTKSELLSIYDVCSRSGKSLRLYAHYHSSKAREWSSANAPGGFVDPEKSTDVNDARALAFYVANNNGISLAKPPDDFSRSLSRQYGELVREESNYSLNCARRHEYDCPMLPEMTKVAEGILKKVGAKDGFVSRHVAFAVASYVMAEVGGIPLRFTYKQKTPGVNFFLKKVLMFSPFHHRGGVGRSNIMWHRFRAYVAKLAEAAGIPIKQNKKYIRFGAHTPEQQRFVRDVMKSVRTQIRAAYAAAVELTSEFQPFEILDDDVRQSLGE